MTARNTLILAIALCLGAFSTEVADQWSGASRFAEAWFFALVPSVLDWAQPSSAWMAAILASVIYALQYLAVFGAVETVWNSVRTCSRSALQN